jgi:hypothetical protein
VKRRKIILIFKLAVILGASVLCMAQQKISDIGSSDPAYPAIQRSVDKGYFTLMDGTQFLPDQNVSRKELAILLDRLDSIKTNTSLSKSDTEELKRFSKQFKSYLESQENEKGLADTEANQIRTEQKTLNYDISRVEDHALRVEKKQKEQDIYIWIGIGLGIFGLMK